MLQINYLTVLFLAYGARAELPSYARVRLQNQEFPSPGSELAPYAPAGWRPAKQFDLPTKATPPATSYGFPDDTTTSQKNTAQNQYYSPQGQSQYAFSQASVSRPQNQYSEPQNQYAVPQNQYASPQNQYAVPSKQYSTPNNQYNIPSNQYSVPNSQYAVPSNQYTSPNNQYAAPQNQQQYQPSGNTYQTTGSQYPSQQNEPQYQVPGNQYSTINQDSSRQNVPQTVYGSPKSQVPSTNYGVPQVNTYTPATEYGAPTTESNVEDTTTDSSDFLKVQGLNTNEKQTAADVEKVEGVYYILLPNSKLQRVIFRTENDPNKMAYTARLQYRNEDQAPVYVYSPAKLTQAN